MSQEHPSPNQGIKVPWRRLLPIRQRTTTKFWREFGSGDDAWRLERRAATKNEPSKEAEMTRKI